MRVEQVTFRGFKSLHDLTLPLGDMTVLTGPNGSGKSNVLAGLEFLGNLYRAGLDRAVASADGYDHVAYRREHGPELSIGFDVAARLSRSELLDVIQDPRPDDRTLLPEYLDVHHALDIRAAEGDPVSVFELSSEALYASDGTGFTWINADHTSDGLNRIEFGHREGSKINERFFPDGFSRRLFEDEQFSRDFFKVFFSDPHSVQLINSLYFTPLQVVGDALGSLRYFQLVPQICRRPGAPGTNVALGSHGENLAAAAAHVRQHDEGAWLKIQEATVGVVPGLEGVEIVPTEDRKLALRFHEQGVLRPWRAGEVSDGTVQAFALFTALFDRRLPLLAVEEPENALHPWILREFVDLCQSESAKQVVLTTHSPALINYVPGEWVNLVWRDEGKTRIGRLLDMDPDAKKLWESGEVGLFDIYDGGVVPRSVPGG